MNLHLATVHFTLTQDGYWAIRKSHRHTLVHLHQSFRDIKDAIPV